MNSKFQGGFIKTAGTKGKVLKALGAAALGVGGAGTAYAALTPEQRKAALEKAKSTATSVKGKAEGAYKDLKGKAEGTYKDLKGKAEGTYKDLKTKGSKAIEDAKGKTVAALGGVSKQKHDAVTDYLKQTMQKNTPKIRDSFGDWVGSEVDNLTSKAKQGLKDLKNTKVGPSSRGWMKEHPKM